MFPFCTRGRNDFNHEYKSIRYIVSGRLDYRWGRSRNDDPNHFLGHGYAYLISSKLGMELAGKQKTFYNRGISGDRASDLYARWNEDTISLKPDLISILIGVNDAWRTMNGEPSGVTDRFDGRIAICSKKLGK